MKTLYKTMGDKKEWSWTISVKGPSVYKTWGPVGGKQRTSKHTEKAIKSSTAEEQAIKNMQYLIEVKRREGFTEKPMKLKSKKLTAKLPYYVNKYYKNTKIILKGYNKITDIVMDKFNLEELEISDEEDIIIIDIPISNMTTKQRVVKYIVPITEFLINTKVRKVSINPYFVIRNVEDLYYRDEVLVVKTFKSQYKMNETSEGVYKCKNTEKIIEEA